MPLNKEFTEVKQKKKYIYLQRKILGYLQLHEENVLRKMKKYLRNIQKMLLQLMNSDKSKKFEYLFKCNRKSFWRQVSYLKKAFLRRAN